MTNSNRRAWVSIGPGSASPALSLLLATLGLAPVADRAQAAFHYMQIEQIIGGVNGDTTAQAIQLRMRTAGQNFVSQTRVEVAGASGANAVTLENLTSNVANGAAGSRVLLTTPNFANYTNIPLVSDFIMDPIPVSYLAAGQVRFMDDFSTRYWVLSWGGDSFTGATTGNTANDANGNFGPPVNGALPSTTLQALQFAGAASAASTTNLADYALTAGAATFINNAGTSFTLVAPPTFDAADFTENGVVNGLDLDVWITNFGLTGTATHMQGDSDNDDDVDGVDFLKWQEQTTSAGAALATGTIVPEPMAEALTTTALLAAWGVRCARWPLRNRSRVLVKNRR